MRQRHWLLSSFSHRHAIQTRLIFDSLLHDLLLRLQLPSTWLELFSHQVRHPQLKAYLLLHRQAQNNPIVRNLQTLKHRADNFCQCYLFIPAKSRKTHPKQPQSLVFEAQVQCYCWSNWKREIYYRATALKTILSRVRLYFGWRLAFG